MKTTKKPPIFEIKKNDFSKIVLSIDTFNDKTFLSIRQYYKNDDGEFKPTKKGVTVPPDKINALVQALQKLSGVNTAK